MMTQHFQKSRFGAYGILLQAGQMIFTLKQSGPYCGLWDLPGGAIEFGESPEEALHRECLEEVAIDAVQIELVQIATHNGVYELNSEKQHFHHIGIIYRVPNWVLRADILPGDEARWFNLKTINLDDLTPFARGAQRFIQP
jgi:ADP-ribose pyrophosphatase YjhB (NUDIX family)